MTLKFTAFCFYLILHFKGYFGQASNVLPLCTENLSNETLCKLDSKSDPILPPKPWPLKIQPIIHLKSVTKVDEALQYVTLDLQMTMLWTDKRIAFKGIGARIVSDNELKKFWHTKPWYFNKVSEEYYRSGTVHINKRRSLYVEEVRVNFACQMDFRHFPFDSHVCNATFGNFGYTEDHVMVDMATLWYTKSHTNQPMINKSQEVLIINDTTTQFNFEISLLEPFASMCENARFSATGISLKLSRKRSGVPYSSFFIPTGTFTVVSMVSFLIQPDAVPGRMGLIVTLLLISSNVYAQVDHHGFSNMDVWAIGSQIPIIFALFQYGLVLLLSRYCNIKRSFRKFDCMSACIIATYYFGFNCYFWGLASRPEYLIYL